MCEQDFAFQELLARVRGEYLEMPGLRLTVSQASRLWGLDAVVCDALLSCLETSGFLRRTRLGAYGLAAADGAGARVFPFRSFGGEDQQPRPIEASANHKQLS